MKTHTPSIRTLLNWLASARIHQNLSKKDLRRLEYSVGLFLARHSNTEGSHE